MTTRRKPTIDDQLVFKRVTDPQISPDGSRIVFVMGDGYLIDSKNQKANIWVVPGSGGAPRRLTTGARTDQKPRWSPDGKTLAFLSDRARDGELNLYLLPMDGGEAVQLTDMEGATPLQGGVPSIAWSPDGSRIALLKYDPDTPEEKQARAEKREVIEFEQHPKFMRLYVVDVATGNVTRASPDGLQVWDFAWSPDGQTFAAVASDLPFESDWYINRLVTFPTTGGGSARTVFDSKRMFSKPVWSPDGRQIAFTSSTWSDKYSVRGGVFVAPSAGGEARELTGGHVASYSWIEWSKDGKSVKVTGPERGGSCIVDLDVASGKATHLWHGDYAMAEGNYPHFSADRNGNLAMVLENATSPRDVYLARPSRGGYELTKLTDLHPQARDLALAATEEIHWKGADGLEIQGWLVRPAGARRGQRLPLICLVHGGPTSLHANVFHSGTPGGFPQLLAAQGFAVLMPNPRGSVGWGLEFAESNLGDMGGKDWEDIQKGVDYCISQGIADPNRLGLMGGSYGGFMTAWGVSQTDRFRAAVMSAGVSDWRSYHGMAGIQNWDYIYYNYADPFDPDGTYRKFSPITYVKNVKTPTLIVHGEVDTVVPVEQAYQFHRALKDLGVEVELVVYPREPHGYREKAHIRDVVTRSVEWMVRHLEP